MKKLHFVLLSIGLIAITFVEPPHLYGNSVNIANAKTGFSWGNFFKSLFTPTPPVKPRKAASRGDMCMISPDLSDENNKPRTVWSNKPLFLRRSGDFKKIGVSSSMDLINTNLFPRDIVPGQNTVTYDGTALTPGETYYWWLSLGNSPNAFIPFKIMEPQQRQRITNELQKLEQQQKAKNATAETIALAKTNYFLSQQPPLWSDALQQAYSVNKPSPELSKIRESIITELCKP